MIQGPCQKALCLHRWITFSEDLFSVYKCGCGWSWLTDPRHSTARWNASPRAMRDPVGSYQPTTAKRSDVTRPSADELAAVCADMVNSDGVPPADTIRDGRPSGDLVTPGISFHKPAKGEALHVQSSWSAKPGRFHLVNPAKSVGTRCPAPDGRGQSPHYTSATLKFRPGASAIATTDRGRTR